MNCIQTENPIDSVNKGSINHNVRKKKKSTSYVSLPNLIGDKRIILKQHFLCSL